MGLFILLISMVLMLFQLLLFDDDATRLVATFPSHIRHFFYLTTDIGKSNWILIGAGTLVLASIALDWSRFQQKTALRLRHFIQDLAFTFYCVAVSGLLVQVLKKLFGRARPKLFEQGGHLQFKPFEFDATFASFPSGHSTTFAAFAMVLYLRFPKFWPIWLAFALLGGASRVMVAAHYPADVAAGLLIGAMFTWLTARWLAQRGLMFKFLPNSKMPKRRLPRF